MTLFGPLVGFDAITQDESNRCLVAWGHKMGPWERPFRRMGGRRGRLYQHFETMSAGVER